MKARWFVAAMLFAAACGQQQLSTPTSPSVPAVGGVRLETEEGLAASGPQNAGPLASFAVDPSVFKGGEATRGTVTLATPAPAGGTVVTLSADDSAVTVPGSIAIAAGGTSGTFQITTKVVQSDVRIRITASAGGGSLTAVMRITPENAIASVSVDPTRITGGSSATGTVTLSSKASSDGTTVTLSSSHPEARVPASVTISAGNTSGTFTVDTQEVSADWEVWIGAAVGRDRREFQIRVVPSRSGGSSSGTVTIGGVVE